jgi:cell division protein FtsW
VNSQLDRSLLFIVIALITIGLMAVYSSTSVITPDMIEKGEDKYSQFHYLKKQLLALLLGVVVMFAAYKVKLEFIRKMAVPLLILSLIVLLLVFTSLGITANGARRWIRLFFFSFQPSELVKLAMIVFLAWYMSRESFKKDNIIYFLIPILIMGVFQGIFLKQPDFGAAVSLAILTISMLLLGGARLAYIGGVSLIAMISLGALLADKSYRVKRLTAFLNPWDDPMGSGFQLIQSYIALGSGGLTGVGPGESKQKLLFLPEVHTDFIFSLIGEEAGFVAALIIIFLFALLFYRGIIIAKGASNNPFPYLMAAGITLMITIQALINFCVVTGLAPTKGLPLPFISYGGSSMIVNLIAVGLLLNVSKRQESPHELERAQIHTKMSKYGTDKPALQKQWHMGFGYNRCRQILRKRICERGLS